MMLLRLLYSIFAGAISGLFMVSFLFLWAPLLGLGVRKYSRVGGSC